MKPQKLIAALLLIFISNSSLSSQKFSFDGNLAPALSFSKISERLLPLPHPQSAQTAETKYTYSGIPAYAFSDETQFTPILLNAIKNTNYALDVALYNINIPALARALLSARERGVKVRLVFDLGHVKPYMRKQIKYLKDNKMDIRVMRGKGGSGSMHNKYAVFDGQLLQTGSANWTFTAQNNNYENMMFTADKTILDGYEKNFEWMWTHSKSIYNLEAKYPPFSPPPADPNPSVYFNGRILPKYAFSPRSGTQSNIIKAINAARKEINVAMFTFTSKPIFQALVQAAQRGVKVRLLLFAGQKFPFFYEAVSAKNITLKFSPGRVERGMMHNKYAVFDNKLLINGAYNWTFTAEMKNAENTIFTTNPVYISGYKKKFEQLFSTGYYPSY